MHEPITAADGTDYKRIVNERSWRVRVRVHTEIKADAPVNGDVEVEPSGVGIVVSVALLDENDEVAVSPTGKLLIFAPHTLTLQREAITREDFDPNAEIEKVIQNQIAVAEKELDGKAKLEAMLAPWRPVEAANDE